MWHGDAAYLKEFPPVPPTKGAKPLSKCGGHNWRECRQCQGLDKPPTFANPVLGLTPFSPANMVRRRGYERQDQDEDTWEQIQRWLDHCDAIFGITRNPDPFAHLEWPRPP